MSFNKQFKAVVDRLATQHLQDILDAYVKGELAARKYRVLSTKWAGQAREEVSTNRGMINLLPP